MSQQLCPSSECESGLGLAGCEERPVPPLHSRSDIQASQPVPIQPAIGSGCESRVSVEAHAAFRKLVQDLQPKTIRKRKIRQYQSKAGTRALMMAVTGRSEKVHNNVIDLKGGKSSADLDVDSQESIAEDIAGRVRARKFRRIRLNNEEQKGDCGADRSDIWRDQGGRGVNASMPGLAEREFAKNQELTEKAVHESVEGSGMDGQGGGGRGRKRRRCSSGGDESDRVLLCLDQDHQAKLVVSEQWPTKAPPDRLGELVQEFRDYLVHDDHDTACCSTCAQLVKSSDLERCDGGSAEVRFIQARERADGGKSYLDRCGVHAANLHSQQSTTDLTYSICSPCRKELRRGRLPRLSLANGLDVGCCQSLPSYLSGLTQLEEIVISRGRVFGSIIKLRAPGTSADACYRRVKGHVVVVPLRPQALLKVLPCTVDDLMDQIQVIWIGKTRPTEVQLSPWLQVRKSVIVRALNGLVRNNPLYADVQVDQALLDRWPESGVHSHIMDSIVIEDNVVAEKGERGDYLPSGRTCHGAQEPGGDIGRAASPGLQEELPAQPTTEGGKNGSGSGYGDDDQEEDSLHSAYEESIRASLQRAPPGHRLAKDPDTDPCANVELVTGHPCTGSVLADVDQEQVNFEPEVLRLLCAQRSECRRQPPAKLSNPSTQAPLVHGDNCPTQSHQAAEPDWSEREGPKSAEVLVYKQGGGERLRNMYEDQAYFTASFPTLFWTGGGGHLEQRSRPVSFGSWIHWLLGHHSRRMVVVDRMPYLSGKKKLSQQLLTFVALNNKCTGQPRFARHVTLLYLLYDSLIRRQSAIGHSILMKKASWEQVRERMAVLTPEVLLGCARDLEHHNKIENPDVLALLNGVKSIGAMVPNSCQQRSRMRVEMKSMVVRYGVPAIWFTLNPSDLRNPLVLKLSGCTAENSQGTSLGQFCAVTATMNPVAVAGFFHSIISAFFNILVRANREDEVGGIFGPAESYYGAVETNGRGMLHLHGLIWLRGNMGFSTLRSRVKANPEFASRVVAYLEGIISECVSLRATDAGLLSKECDIEGAELSEKGNHMGTNEKTADTELNAELTSTHSIPEPLSIPQLSRLPSLSPLPPPQRSPTSLSLPSIPYPETKPLPRQTELPYPIHSAGSNVIPELPPDLRHCSEQGRLRPDWPNILMADANEVALRMQMHSPRHMATCFKYHRGKRGCRFGKPEKIKECSEVSEDGVVFLRRNNQWVNSWNVAIASTLRANHDVSFIATRAKMLSLIHYVTNYATKMEAPVHHALVLAAVVSKQQMGTASLNHDQRDTSNPRNTVGSNELGEIPGPGGKSSQFLLRCFNKLSSNREISGVQAAATLLGYPENYTPGAFVTVQLESLAKTVVCRVLTALSDQDLVGDYGNPEAGEECVSVVSRSSPGVGAFDDYIFRGDRLRDLCLYDYKSTVIRRVRSREGGGGGVDFTEGHPLVLSHSQRVIRSYEDFRTVKFLGRMFCGRDGPEASDWYCPLIYPLFIPSP